MRRYANLLGLVGTILLFFGGVSLLGYGTLGAYAAIHLILGAVLVAGWLASSSRNLSALLASRQTRRGANLLASSSLFIGLLILINLVGVRYERRLDLTEEGLFSLSPQTQRVLAAIDQPVELQAFVEGGVNPPIESLLESFRHGSEFVRVTIIDPDVAPQVAEQAGVRTYGTVRVAYREHSANVLDPSEESITNAVIKVTRTSTRKICFVEGEGEPSIEDSQTPQGFGAARAALENENYLVESVVLLQEPQIPAQCDLTVLAAPQTTLAQPVLHALEEGLRSAQPQMFLLPPRSGNELTPLLSRWGVRLGEDIVVDEVIRLFEGPTLGLSPIVSTYGAHPITLEMKERTLFPLTRSVRPSEEPGIIATSIASTSPSSWSESDLNGVFERSEAELDEAGGDEAGPVSVAVAASADLTELKRGVGESRLVVFGTAELADNQNLYQVFNHDLFLNAVAWLVAEEDLVAIRAKSVRASRVRFTENEATTIFYLAVLVLPELMIILGLFIWWRRSRL